MSRWRIAVVLLLLGGPFVALAGVGSYHLVTGGVWVFAWLGMLLCMTAGYALAWHWQRQRALFRPPEYEAPTHWSDRDQAAFRLVEARARDSKAVTVEKLGDVQFYLGTASTLAQDLANFYHPGATDPVGSLTIPEILAVTELAASDLWQLVDQHLPGGHLLTVRDWQRARTAVSAYQTANQLYWIGAALYDPVQTGLRYLATRAGVTTPLQKFQTQLYRWFYEAYVHRVGTYLIEVHSGRLRLGAAAYRQRLRQLRGEADPAADILEDPDRLVEEVPAVVVTLIGQVKAGKSSVCNALLGEQRARTDVLPATSFIERYELKVEGVPTRFVLNDTVGYAHSGPRADQLASTREAARQSDLLLLVLHSRNPGRQADLDQLNDLRQWFAAHPELRKPPVLAVLTHIDLLSPALEWEPPYQLDPPIRPKEVNIRGALQAAFDQLGDHLIGAVPICASAGRVYGVEEWLLPSILGQLDQVRGVAFLRAIKAEADKGKARKVFGQLLAAGKLIARFTWENLEREMKMGHLPAGLGPAGGGPLGGSPLGGGPETRPPRRAP